MLKPVHATDHLTLRKGAPLVLLLRTLGILLSILDVTQLQLDTLHAIVERNRLLSFLLLLVGAEPQTLPRPLIAERFGKLHRGDAAEGDDLRLHGGQATLLRDGADEQLLFRDLGHALEDLLLVVTQNAAEQSHDGEADQGLNVRVFY